MIEFKRYPHVQELILHYAGTLNNKEIVSLFETGVNSKEDAYFLSRFVLKMIDQMAVDTQEKIQVLGGTDNPFDFQISIL